MLWKRVCTSFNGVQKDSVIREMVMHAFSHALVGGDLGHWQLNVAFETLFGSLPSVAGLRKCPWHLEKGVDAELGWAPSPASGQTSLLWGQMWAEGPGEVPLLRVWLEFKVDKSRTQSWVVQLHSPLHPFEVTSCVVLCLLSVLNIAV